MKLPAWQSQPPYEPLKPSLLWNLALKLLRPSTMNPNCYSRNAVAAALAGFVSRLGLKLHALAALALLSCLPAAAAGPLIFSCSADNDLFRVASQNGLELRRLDTPDAAVDAATKGSGVLILAEGYPEKPTALSAELFRQAAEKKLRLYVEFPLPAAQHGIGPAGGAAARRVGKYVGAHRGDL